MNILQIETQEMMYDAGVLVLVWLFLTRIQKTVLLPI